MMCGMMDVTFAVTAEQRQNLGDSVLWIGGSPCAGKSTIAERLSAAGGPARFSVDEDFAVQSRGFSPERQPALCAWLQASSDERWLQPVPQLLDEVIACYSEHCAFIVDALVAQTRSGSATILTEGSCLLPDCLAPMAATAAMVWVVPTPDFQRRHYGQRDWARDSLTDCREPERAFRNWMDRDVAFAAWVGERCKSLCLPCIVVDGQQDVEAIAARVGRQLRLRPQ
ncbi:MAG: hypothetical protein CME04_18570 [Gemmatimonadaceae bacterium]|jgi:2-phosphoglycerate kinase|nr:hypothetical protein [Gemmatimonadaceae bacterium]